MISMIELVQIFIIAIVQGVTEFLPISSSGHSAVIEHLYERLGHPLTEDSTDFIKLNVLLHVGSLIAILIVYRQRIIGMFGKDWRLIPMLIIATIPVVVVGYPIYKFAPWSQDYLPLITASFVATGFMLLLTLRFSDGEKTCSTMTWKDALIIGFAQAVAIVPGISRSGITIVTALLCKLKREDAAAFSFLLAIPVIAGTGLLAGVEMIRHVPDPDASGISNWLLLLGASISCVAGIIAILFLLDWLKKGRLWYFAIWAFAMALVAFVLAVLPMPEKTEVVQLPVEVLNVCQTSGFFPHCFHWSE